MQTAGWSEAADSGVAGEAFGAELQTPLQQHHHHQEEEKRWKHRAAGCSSSSSLEQVEFNSHLRWLKQVINPVHYVFKGALTPSHL